MKPLVVVGYDQREDLAYKVCKASLLRHSVVDVLPLKKEALEAAAIYRRPMFLDQGQTYDGYDGKPFSTEFSFTRFLTPLLGRLLEREWVLFVDSDFLFRADVSELFGMGNEDLAVHVVKHDYKPRGGYKMRTHQKQEGYNRKLWSALMLMNVSRCRITPWQVCTQSGSWLHGFGWTDSNSIGSLPEEWHWLPGHSASALNAKAVHFTEGTPDIPEYASQPYADEWLAYAEEVG